MRGVLLALALLTAACSRGTSTTTEMTEPPPSTIAAVPDTTNPDSGLGYRWQVGDCVDIETHEDLPYEPYGMEEVVDCAEPHAYEVFFTGDFEAAPDESFPDDAGEEVREICAAAFVEYTGLHLTESLFDVVLYLPDRAEWSRGLRYQGCVVSDPRGGGDVPRREGSVRGETALLQRTPGQCLEGGNVRSPVVDCRSPHRGEVIGLFTHPGDSEEPFPGSMDFRAAADTGCAEQMQGYVAEPRSGQLVLPLATGSLLTAVEWDAGLRTVHCVGLVFDDGRTPLPVVGSLAETGWWVLEGGIAA